MMLNWLVIRIRTAEKQKNIIDWDAVPTINRLPLRGFLLLAARQLMRLCRNVGNDKPGGEGEPILPEDRRKLSKAGMLSTADLNRGIIAALDAVFNSIRIVFRCKHRCKEYNREPRHGADDLSSGSSPRQEKKQ